MSRKLVDCIRCGGSGKIEQFGHIQRGVCFECAGSGKSSPRKPLTPTPVSPPKPFKRVQLLGEPWIITKENRYFNAGPENGRGEAMFVVTPEGQVLMSASQGGGTGWGTPSKKNTCGYGTLTDWVLEKAGVGEYERAEMGPREWDIWLAFLLRLQAALQQAVRR